jgi:hypothetical protein
MRNTVTVLALLLTATCAVAGEPRPVHGWTVKPSLQLFATVDEVDDEAPEFVRDLVAANPALSLAAGTDVDWQGERGRMQLWTLGLIGSPSEKDDRNAFLAGRLHAVRPLGRHWRLSLDDSGRWQRHEVPSPTDFQRNEAVLGLEWRRGEDGAVGLRLGDRRRSVPRVPELGFERQAIGVFGRIGVGRRTSVEAATAWQPFSARTAHGGRLVTSLDVARFTVRGVTGVWLGWFEPRSDRVLLTTADGGDRAAWATPLGDAEAGIGTRNALVAELLLPVRAELSAVDSASAVEGGWTADPALFDPLESDSDEWDFGQRKQVLGGMFSRRIDNAWSLSVVFRLQHKTGPNLLLPGGSCGSSCQEDRLALRGSARYRLGGRVSLLLQACHLRNWSDQPSLTFSRTLVAVGLQFRP